jgi:hypothetical protein
MVVLTTMPERLLMKGSHSHEVDVREEKGFRPQRRMLIWRGLARSEAS